MDQVKTINADQLLKIVLGPDSNSECLREEGTSLRSAVVKVWLTAEPPDHKYPDTIERCWFQLKNGQKNWIGFDPELLVQNLQKLLCYGIEFQDART